MATAYTTSVCSKCKVETDDFAPHAKLGRQAYCRACQREYRRAYSAAGKDRERRYGLTPAEQDAMFLAQGGCCGGCGDAIEQQQAHLDHHHATGRVRGFLCLTCNLGLGYLKDDRERLLGLVAYLERTSS